MSRMEIGYAAAYATFGTEIGYRANYQCTMSSTNVRYAATRHAHTCDKEKIQPGMALRARYAIMPGTELVHGTSTAYALSAISSTEPAYGTNAAYALAMQCPAPTEHLKLQSMLSIAKAWLQTMLPLAKPCFCYGNSGSAVTHDAILDIVCDATSSGGEEVGNSRGCSDDNTVLHDQDHRLRDLPSYA
eukprot:2383981-Rhodomonas_salina.3